MHHHTRAPKHGNVLACALILATTCCLTTLAQAQVCTPSQTAKLLASDGAGDDNFSTSTALDGDVAIIGASGNDDLGTDSGTAYAYRFDGSQWVEEQLLLASDGAAGDEFGLSAAVHGNVAIVGAPGDGDHGASSGAAYIYRYSGTVWAEDQKLTASDGAANAMFGTSVAIHGNVAVVGADGDAGGSNQAGAAYVFRFDGSNWVEERKLLASDGAAGDHFGTRVDLFGDVAVVSAILDADHGFGSGSAYVFRFDGLAWVEEDKLTASDGESGDTFGSAVSVDSGVAIIGASLDADAGFATGSAYVFRFNGTGWDQEAKLVPSNAASLDQIGQSLDIEGDLALIGAPQDAFGSPGTAYLFRFDGTAWIEEGQLQPSDGAAQDEIGFSVSLSGGRGLVGSRFDDANGPFAGSAYIFDLGCAVPTIGVTYCSPAVANSTGGPGVMGVTGSQAAMDNDVTLHADHLPLNAFGFFLTSRTQGATMAPGSVGILCLGGAIGRYVGPGQVQSAGATGTIDLAVDLTQHPTPTGLIAVQPGDTWNFTLWHRDVATGGNTTSNLTDAVEVTFN